jgi:hypothetical protein
LHRLQQSYLWRLWTSDQQGISLET